MSKPTPPKLRQSERAWLQRGPEAAWIASNMVRSGDETVWLAEPSGKRGRPATVTDAAIQACLTSKALFGLVAIEAPLVRATMATRQTTGLMASLPQLAGLDWAVSDFSTVSRRQKGLEVAIPYRPGTGALHLLMDSTGIEFEGEGAWFAKKHGPSKPRRWHEVDLGIDADTLEIRAIETTGNRVGDAPMLPELLDQIPTDQPSAKSVQTAHMTCGAATPQLRRATLAPSYQRAGMHDHGWKTRPARRPAATLSASRATFDERSGGVGAATSDEGWSKQDAVLQAAP